MDKQIKEELEEKEREKKPLKKPARPISLAYRDRCLHVSAGRVKLCKEFNEDLFLDLTAKV
ncbi:unnamed protein product [Pneumocystis jirovecii]|uniref:Uncharacterized protein n=1 Tax=Pneumocystis jirovecii TaxID=42068 RepID=L0PCW2_PNEJI|nr:unnamed protein product [Pneumocystis jirovecii]